MINENINKFFLNKMSCLDGLGNCNLNTSYLLFERSDKGLLEAMIEIKITNNIIHFNGEKK